MPPLNSAPPTHFCFVGLTAEDIAARGGVVNSTSLLPSPAQRQRSPPLFKLAPAAGIAAAPGPAAAAAGPGAPVQPRPPSAPGSRLASASPTLKPLPLTAPLDLRPPGEAVAAAALRRGAGGSSSSQDLLAGVSPAALAGPTHSGATPFSGGSSGGGGGSSGRLLSPVAAIVAGELQLRGELSAGSSGRGGGGSGGAAAGLGQVAGIGGAASGGSGGVQLPPLVATAAVGGGLADALAESSMLTLTLSHAAVQRGAAAAGTTARSRPAHGSLVGAAGELGGVSATAAALSGAAGPAAVGLSARPAAPARAAVRAMHADTWSSLVELGISSPGGGALPQLEGTPLFPESDRVMSGPVGSTIATPAMLLFGTAFKVGGTGAVPGTGSVARRQPELSILQPSGSSVLNAVPEAMQAHLGGGGGVPGSASTAARRVLSALSGRAAAAEPPSTVDRPQRAPAGNPRDVTDLEGASPPPGTAGGSTRGSRGAGLAPQLLLSPPLFLPPNTLLPLQPVSTGGREAAERVGEPGSAAAAAASHGSAGRASSAAAVVGSVVARSSRGRRLSGRLSDLFTQAHGGGWREGAGVLPGAQQPQQEMGGCSPQKPSPPPTAAALKAAVLRLAMESPQSQPAMAAGGAVAGYGAGPGRPGGLGGHAAGAELALGGGILPLLDLEGAVGAAGRQSNYRWGWECEAVGCEEGLPGLFLSVFELMSERTLRCAAELVGRGAGAAAASLLPRALLSSDGALLKQHLCQLPIPPALCPCSNTARPPGGLQAGRRPRRHAQLPERPGQPRGRNPHRRVPAQRGGQRGHVQGRLGPDQGGEHCVLQKSFIHSNKLDTVKDAQGRGGTGSGGMKREWPQRWSTCV